MDKKPPPQTRDTSSTKISDSNYGSLITESSSSCLSLLSDSDLFDDLPSTSGCSSEMASMMQSREKKRQKVKEFLKELKSMVPKESSGSKLGTLSTLDYVVSSMRKIREEQKEKSQVFKAPPSEPVALPSLQCPESVDFRNVNDGIILNTQSELTVAVSLKNHVVLDTSTAFMDLLGYPYAWWKGRLLKDFVHKKDIMTVNSYINSETSETISSSTESKNQTKMNDSPKQQKQFFYARIRQFRSISSGFSLSTSGSYMFFKVMVAPRSPENPPETAAEEQKTSKCCMMLYFAPMVSPYKDGQLPPEPEQRTFSLRHSLFCSYSYTHANAVALLGFLPQDIIGTSIFDYYHPDDLPQLLDIYKKAMLSLGQPVKSGLLRIRTRNGSYVKVTTEWSSFMNPWDRKLEFIIAQHTIVRPPDKPNVFEEDRQPAIVKAEGKKEISRKLIEKIRDVLQKPVTSDPSPLTPSDSGGGVTSPEASGGANPTRDVEKGLEKGKNEKEGSEATAQSEVSSSMMDEKSISSLYNQINYSLNIKKFLLSHPKAFPVSDEDSSTDVKDPKDDSGEETNEEEEMQVEIPVVRPPSCGSSTQVHVSEQGFHEEVPSPPSFGGEDPNLTRETMDNQLMLTQDSLRKHTRAQELLYLQDAAKEQPYLFHLTSKRPVGHRGRQKRSRPSGLEETTDVFKFAKNAKGQRGANNSGGAGIFMSNFPVTAVDIMPTSSQPTSMGMTNQSPNVVGVMPGPFQPGMGMMPQLTMVPIDPTTSVHLQPFLPTPTNNMQWPYYPQSGYSLLPQVMAGFYQPLLQPLPMTQASPFNGPNSSKESQAFPHPGPLQQPAKVKKQQKSGTDSDNHLSSADDTSSSIQYLLDAVSGNNSSPNEETDEKLREKLQRQTKKLPRHRQALPPWLQTINWTPEVRLMYKMSTQKAKNVLKKDREALKKMVQSEHIKAHLETLLEEVEHPDYVPATDEEADYLFYPEPRTGDAVNTVSEKDEEKTPRKTFPPTFEIGPGLEDEGINSGDTTKHGTSEETDQSKESTSRLTTVRSQMEHDMEVVMTEDPSDSVIDETAVEPITNPELLEKVLSPASQVSSSSGKEGSAEGEVSAEGSAASPTPCPLGVEGAKETKSAKDGCSSDDGRSDVGSDKGSENSNNSRQKNEDAQSSSSKVSSNLTPSEERSTEDAGSSIKESDMSTPKGSFASSNDKMSTDSGAESTSASTLTPDILEKLFVPLRIRMCHGDNISQPNKVMAQPFWQQEADVSPLIAMRYNMQPLDISTILANDRRRLSTMHQSLEVSHQLLELLQEVDGQDHRESKEASKGHKGGAAEGSGEFSAHLMKPPRAKQSKSILGVHKKPKDASACAKDKSHPTGKEDGQEAESVEKQLMDKLQSLTPGQHSEDWPGDVIMSKVFLPIDLVSGHSAAATAGRAHDSEILDTVD